MKVEGRTLQLLGLALEEAHRRGAHLLVDGPGIFPMWQAEIGDVRAPFGCVAETLEAALVDLLTQAGVSVPA